MPLWTDADIKRLVTELRAQGLMLKADASPVDEIAYGAFVKAEDEKRFSLGVAYPANYVDAKRGADGKVDVVPADVLEDAAWSWMRKSAHSTTGAGLFHFNGAGGGAPVDDCCEIVESFIWRFGDTMLKAVDGSDMFVPNGSWFVGGLWSPEVWPFVKSMYVSGWSPEGTARRRLTRPAGLVKLKELAHAG